MPTAAKVRKMVEEAATICDPGGCVLTDNKEKKPLRKFKKTRRGKKKKLKKTVPDGRGAISGNRQHAAPPTENRSNPPVAAILGPHVAPKQPMLRPIQVPNAPKNSTQFIIDDHQNCNLYKSFEEELHHVAEEDVASSMGFEDIDYEYLSPDDLDMATFYERDFEATYRRAREEKLLGLDRDALLEQLGDLERTLLELEAQRAKSAVDELQKDLLRLQRENRWLRRTNRVLVTGSTDTVELEDSVESDE